MEFSLDDAQRLLSATPQTLTALVSSLPQPWVQAREAPDEWSPYEVCGHLLHIEECDWIDRTRQILEHGTTRVFEAVDREAGFTRFAGWSAQELLDRFAEVRRANLTELMTLVSPERLDRRGLHPTFGEVSLRQLLATWVVHDQNHLHQIVKTLAKHYTEAVGPWRAFLPLLDADGHG
jgi:hypothetical protein